jgi:hypothetical protein
MEGIIIFGSSFLVVTVYGIWRAWRTSVIASWPRTKGIITLFSVEAVRETFKSAPYTRYISHLKYSYAVGQSTYVSTRFSLHNLLVGNSSSELRDLLGGASQGDSVDVFYDPRKPSRGLLVRPGNTELAVILIVGISGLALVATVALAHR